MFYRLCLQLAVVCWGGISLQSCATEPIEENKIERVIDLAIRRIYDSDQVGDFEQINQQGVMSYFTADELEVLANDYWVFDVSTDVEVFICRDIRQRELPFWLPQRKFQKTSDTVNNDNVTYEVWSKTFEKGRVRLGINGFDRHRYVYFVIVKGLDDEKDIELTPIWPIAQEVNPVERGSVIYHDWDELTLTQMPDSFKGGYILPTNRGRSREAHLIDAFRRTDFPAANIPDQFIRTWTDDPRTTLNISWRTSMDVSKSMMKYWEKGSQDTIMAEGKETIISDVLLSNNPDVKRYHVKLEKLKPGSTYEFTVVSDDIEIESQMFTTDSGDGIFEFGWFGDIHNDEQWGKNLPRWKAMYPNAKFYLQVGDLVNTGQYRDQWDRLLAAARPIMKDKPFMAVPGNHDSQEGLFPNMYLKQLSYPHNGPNNLPKGLSYNFVYGNTFFLMLDIVTFSVKDQEAWVENLLKNSKERFKVAVFHFAPHTEEADYNEISEGLGRLFDRYEVDLVLTGHFHYYYRTAVDNDTLKHPVYVMSVGTKEKDDEMEVKKGCFGVHKGYLYQHVKVDNSSLYLTSIDSLGTKIDEFRITKTN
ncbi:metallophosphoesterase family protein [Sphingobacterium sp. UT-1RO-CII-1]|uniref:purple acid phosphatase family protein n=1 Tax=Sphingobacterium sp. UT-1RO-CII-1 TaxID=2995225 RepID=UPI00227D3CE3|nr:metallophosphoesterase family protein [Sphingobacterium sp. UT-1RO-CII-1]MCY4779424.1 metallophosphoesterase family protein [Sphingobacterium sp. UT-1RO-CII-1]